MCFAMSPAPSALGCTLSGSNSGVPRSGMCRSMSSKPVSFAIISTCLDTSFRVTFSVMTKLMVRSMIQDPHSLQSLVKNSPCSCSSDNSRFHSRKSNLLRHLATYNIHPYTIRHKLLSFSTWRCVVAELILNEVEETTNK